MSNNPLINPEVYLQAAELILQADALLICAGAGIGVDSGLPDFRGNQGFWKAYPALEQKGLTFMELANPKGFDLNPERAWGFYGHRYQLYYQTQPHNGFQILKKWCSSKAHSHFVFTSNVDGHFQKAGFNEDQILECHGSINHLQCSGEDGRQCTGIWSAETNTNLQSLLINNKSFKAQSMLPKCPQCNGIARPNILMFEDYYWHTERTEAQEERFQQWKLSLNFSGDQTKKTLLVIEIGAGTAIPSVRLLSESMNTAILRINLRESQGGTNVVSIPTGGLEALQEIDKIINAKQLNP